MVKSYICAYRQASYPLPNGSNVVFADMGLGIKGSLYTSANSSEQAMIESLPDFGGVIKVYKTYGEPDPVAPKLGNVVKVSEVAGVIVKEYSEVTRTQDAISIVNDVCKERGIECKFIRSREAAIERAKFLNISFPNLN